MIAAAYDEADRRIRSGSASASSSSTGTSSRSPPSRPRRGIAASSARPDRLHPRLRLHRQGRRRAASRQPRTAGQWADGQLLRVLHGRAKAAAATLASVAAKTRANPRTRHLDLTDMDKAVTYLTNNHKHMRYDNTRRSIATA